MTTILIIDPNRASRAEVQQMLKQHYPQFKVLTKGAEIEAILESEKEKCLTLSNNTEINFLKINDIIRLESLDNITLFHSIHKNRVAETKPLKLFEQLLPKSTFFRPHQSHIINKHFVDKICKAEGWKIRMHGGAVVPISRRKQQAFLAWMNQ